MMEIDEEFFMLKNEDKKWLFNTEDEAIKKLKETKDTEKTSILKVDVSGDQWAIVQVPWNRIAMKLMEK